MDCAPEKPPRGSRCNGCGLCCAAELCQAAEIVLGPVEPPCPLLNFHDGRFWCALVEAEAAAGMEPLIRNALGVGNGCLVDDPTPSDGAAR